MISIRSLEIRIEPNHDHLEEGATHPTIEFTLDGRDLHEWVHRATPASMAETHYLGHHAGVDLRALLLGEMAYASDDEPGEFPWEQWGGYTPILGCNCGVVDCGPLLGRIEVGPDAVTWRGLRDGYQPELDYGLDFRFDREAYEAAIAAAR